MSDSQLQAGSEPSRSEIPDQGDVTQPGPSKKAFLPFGSDQPLYFPLLHGQVIRLIELSPGIWNDPVSIRIFITELDHAPEYDALSYVWGDPSKTVPILCNGRRLNVTLNLNGAFKRVRLPHHPRIVWADAVCINQRNMDERSHHVAFMGDIYRNAKKVLVCMGKDVDGGAEDAAGLVHEISDMVSKYKSIKDMPVLRANSPLYDDPRWYAIRTLHKVPWFTRTWVLQEVGLAKDPRILYGVVEFPYRDLMKLATWTMQCAPNLDTRQGISFFSIHTEWVDWSDGWRTTKEYPDETIIELLNQARWLSCSVPHDHIYSLLGHPLAQLKEELGSGLIVEPDYKKDPMDVWFDLALHILEKHGLRVISAVEHDDDNLAANYPSWVPWYWTEYTMCTLGSWYGFYYAADGGMSIPPSGEKPFVDEKRQLHVRGITVDIVKAAFAFTSDDLAADPAKLHAMASSSTQPSVEPNLALRTIWRYVQDVSATSKTPYGSDWLTAFSLSLIAGITTYTSAEDKIAEHRHDFATYFRLWLQGAYGSSAPQSEALLETLERFKAQGEHRHKGNDEEVEGQDEGSDEDGDAEKFFIDFKLMCEGRSFFFTENGYFGIGSWIARPGDRVCVLFGAKCPFLFRPWGSETGTERRWKLIQDAYVHGLMRGETMGRFTDGELRVSEESFVIC